MASQKSSDIDYNDFAQLRRVAIAYAMKKGLTDEQMCEDFGQEYCLAVWLKKNGSMSIEFCNFLRKYYGRNDKHAPIKQRLKSEALHSTVSYEQLFLDSTGKRR